MIVRPLELSPKSGPEASHATDPRPRRRRGPAGTAQILSRREGAAAALESKDAGAVSTARQDVMLAARQRGSDSRFQLIDDTDLAGTIPYLPKG